MANSTLGRYNELNHNGRINVRGDIFRHRDYLNALPDDYR